MFLDNLSASVRRVCDARKLGYEAASEQCSLSFRYFGSIARGKTTPSILTLEKLCVGFDLTPNELLLAPELQWEIGFLESEPDFHIRCRHCPYAHAGLTKRRQYKTENAAEYTEAL